MKQPSIFFVYALISGFLAVVASIATTLVLVFALGATAPSAGVGQQKTIIASSDEEALISVVEQTSAAVVSIIVTKDLPKIETYYYNPFFGNDFFSDFFGDTPYQIPGRRQVGTEKREIGGGTGFIVSADGYVVTNKHVVADPEAEYTVLLNDERRIPARVLARDQFNDIAVLKIEAENLTVVALGDSSALRLGQRLVAIGNALGEFRNTVSTGIVSGLSRTIVAGGGGMTEQLSGLIQTDAAINTGNSGGPLLNLRGEVVGINTAVAAGAQNIGFAIPINDVRSVIDSVQKEGRIVRAYLGVRYVAVNKSFAEKNALTFDRGAFISRGQSPDEPAIMPGSPADKAGLRENDIIVKINDEAVTDDMPLARIISRFSPGQQVTVHIVRQGNEVALPVTLEEMPAIGDNE